MHKAYPAGFTCRVFLWAVIAPWGGKTSAHKTHRFIVRKLYAMEATASNA